MDGQAGGRARQGISLTTERQPRPAGARPALEDGRP